jgi:amino acid transporter
MPTETPRGLSARHEGMIESVNVEGSGVDRLKPGAIGLMGVIFVAVTGAAPISAMLFNVPFAVSFGTGIGTPAAFGFATVILTIFSVGYVTLAKHIRAAGGFYSFISHGLGRELGMAAGICGALAYCLFEVSLLGGFAYFANLDFNDWWSIDIPWPLLALFAAVVISIFCWFDVELSVKVLGTALIGEIIILALFDILVIGSGGGSSGLAWDSLNPANAFKGATGVDSEGAAVAGAAGVGIFLAFWSWVGFEAIPNYAEESRNPRRIVPRATLISVVALGVLYVITSFAFVSAFPANRLIASAQNPDGPFFAAMRDFGSNGLATIMQVLILTGSFACAMAFHNVAMRYSYAMGREGMLPRKLGKTHPTHRSPYVASVVQTIVALAIVLLWAIGSGFGDPFDNAYVRVYTMMAVLGVVWILSIQALCALAVIVYFRRHPTLKENPIATIVCPLIALVAQAFTIYLLFANIDVLAGTIGFVQWIKWLALAAVIGSLAYAFYLKSTNRKKYELIGRMIDEGAPTTDVDLDREGVGVQSPSREPTGAGMTKAVVNDPENRRGPS